MTVWRAVIILYLELLVKNSKGLVVKPTEGNDGIVLATVGEVDKGELARMKKRPTMVV
jgi:hypothetical protein